MKYYCAARKQTVKNPKHQNQVRIIGGTLRGRKLGFADATSAHDIITARYDYSFSWVSLAVMVIVGSSTMPAPSRAFRGVPLTSTRPTAGTR